jgi:hypothetical protein
MVELARLLFTELVWYFYFVGSGAVLGLPTCAMVRGMRNEALPMRLPQSTFLGASTEVRVAGRS